LKPGESPQGEENSAKYQGVPLAKGTCQLIFLAGRSLYAEVFRAPDSTWPLRELESSRSIYGEGHDVVEVSTVGARAFEMRLPAGADARQYLAAAQGRCEVLLGINWRSDFRGMEDVAQALLETCAQADGS
jgi:hypothetical protein